MSNRTPEHYASYSDKEIYDALCHVDPQLRHAFALQRNMLLSGWSEDEIVEALRRDAHEEFRKQLDGIQGHLIKRALHHTAVVLDQQRQAQQPKSDLN